MAFRVIDFIIEKDAECLPIEVKSGKDYYVHSALNNVLKDDNYSIKEAIVLCNDNIPFRIRQSICRSI